MAAEGEVEVASGQPYKAWLYNGELPGPAIRVKEGERLVVTVENRLPSGTTVHWHGIPVPNAMDGVPGLTQEPIAPGERFIYEFTAAPAGSYIYHSHVGLQLDRGLYGPLIIEEKTPHISYDREYTLVLDDYLPGPPSPLEELASRGEGTGMGPGMMGPGMMGPGMMGPGMMGPGMMGPGMHGMMGGFIVPPYAGLLINGRLPSDAPAFEVRQGERIRLRLLNPAGATTFHFAVAGHRLTITHADGQPVEPSEVDALFIGMGERYDVLVQASNPGVWFMEATPVESNSPPARAVLRYSGTKAKTAPESVGPIGGLQFHSAYLRALSPFSSGTPDRVFDLILSGRSATQWTLNGQAWPDTEPLLVRSGERIRFRMSNRSLMLHPMHLHGHFFQVGGAVKDTVLVPPHMGQVDFDFIADNPGRWFFHCHNIYHMESGMAREVRYV
ncbi:MAG: multicopper oxidase family protein [Gammaproteobacteria bacterium]|nr:multicopper oxidase family protein [Gammaproteobacteria bacterium]